MPAQGTGINKDEKVHVVAVDTLTGEIGTELTSLTEDSNFSQSDDLNSQSSFSSSQTNVSDGSLKNGEEKSESGVTLAVVSGSSSGSSFSDVVHALSGRRATITTLSTNSSETLSDNRKSQKRPLPKSANTSPVVTKVIITKNPATSQPQAIPIQLGQYGGQTVTIAPGAAGTNIVPQVHGLSATPTKTITISQHGIVSPLKQIQMATLAQSGSPKLPIRKLPISPAKTPTKVTMIPVSIGKSPQKIAPASILGNNVIQTIVTSGGIGNKQTTITMSPSKVIKPGTVHLVQQKPNTTMQPAQTIVINQNKQIMVKSNQGAVKQVTFPSNVQPVQVSGNKFPYIRLVTPQTIPTQATSSSPAQGTTTVTQGKSALSGQTKPIAPAGATLASVLGGQQGSASGQMRITLPVQSATNQLVASKSASGGTQTVQRILLPAAPNQVAIRPAPTISLATSTVSATGSTTITQLPPGTTILSSGGQGLQGFALVPASYVAQLQQQMQVKQPSAPPPPAAAPAPAPPPVSQQRTEYIPIASNNPQVSESTIARSSSNGSLIEPTGARPRKPCNCTKSQCLKLYCDCFANGEFCHNCNCMSCSNNLEHEEERSKAIKSCLDRNPLAFHPKIGKGRDGEANRKHNKGCNCKRSGCLKNYCECYEAKIMCSSSCKCVGCKNFEESTERKTLMHLADAAEVRVQQQTAAKSRLSSQMSDLPSRPPPTGEKLPYSFITSEVVEATCACLMAQAEEAERLKMPPVVQERMVIEEFGRCLLQIIESASKTKINSQTT
ncbi:hypothetical protein CHS0354_017132 [Potamilus streckersoni]|uniref:CRC domain-containing protein n=1 Tax=Potamilus streckersoni TaxID=2493646 RepID=A0AAE0WBX4_9BIVA|nr:hypothetical protein CHS0354_017132 [Potamilus streckersoni]